MGSLTFEDKVGVVSLQLGPEGRQLAVGLGSGGVRLIPVEKLLRSD